MVLAYPLTGKGGVAVLMALKSLSKNFPNLAMVTFGEPDSRFLHALCTNAPLSFPVINLGWIYGEAKCDAYAGSDVFVMRAQAN